MNLVRLINSVHSIRSFSEVKHFFKFLSSNQEFVLLSLDSMKSILHPFQE